MTLSIQKRLVDILGIQAAGQIISDVRIGPGCTAVRLDSGPAGVAWTAQSEALCCTHFKEAGTLTGRPASDLLQLLADENQLRQGCPGSCGV